MGFSGDGFILKTFIFKAILNEKGRPRVAGRWSELDLAHPGVERFSLSVAKKKRWEKLRAWGNGQPRVCLKTLPAILRDYVGELHTFLFFFFFLVVPSFCSGFHFHSQRKKMCYFLSFSNFLKIMVALVNIRLT